MTDMTIKGSLTPTDRPALNSAFFRLFSLLAVSSFSLSFRFFQARKDSSVTLV